MIIPLLAEVGLNPSDYLQFGSLGVGFFNIFLSWRLISALNKQDKIQTQHVILVCIFVTSALGFLLGGAFLHKMEQNPEVTIRFDLQPRWSDSEVRDFGAIHLHDGGTGQDVPVKDAYIPLTVAKGTSIQLDIVRVWKKLQEFDSQLKAIAKQKVTNDKTAGGPDEP
jgi:hypothetical protein